MKVRFEDRILARELRSQGFSFSEIMARIPNLSKGTLNGWLKDIELTPDQKARLLGKIKLGAERGRLIGAFKNLQKRIDLTKQIINTSKAELKFKITDPFFTLGVMLYWAEGSKCGEKVGFTNSDPIMISLMMRWFRKICRVSESKFRIALQIMTLQNKNDTELFWSGITKVPITRFNKTIIKPTPLKGKRNPSYYGTCTIRISDKNLFKKIRGWKLGIVEGFKISAPVAQLDRANRF